MIRIITIIIAGMIAKFVYYQQWENENQREHRDFRQRSPDEQKEYWSWRHSYPDHDHAHEKH